MSALPNNPTYPEAKPRSLECHHRQLQGASLSTSKSYRKSELDQSISPEFLVGPAGPHEFCEINRLCESGKAGRPIGFQEIPPHLYHRGKSSSVRPIVPIRYRQALPFPQSARLLNSRDRTI